LSDCCPSNTQWEHCLLVRASLFRRHGERCEYRMGPEWESLDITCRLVALTILPGYGWIDYPCLISRPTSVLAGTFSRKCLIISGRSSPASSRYVEEQLAHQKLTSEMYSPFCGGSYKRYTYCYTSFQSVSGFSTYPLADLLSLNSVVRY
jgi:hypothetical protein